MLCYFHKNRWLLVAGFSLLFQLQALRGESSWPQWRGPQGTGVSQETGIPVKWNREQVRWRTRIPGRGQSSPVAEGGRIFLTTAAADGKARSVVCIEQQTEYQFYLNLILLMQFL